jgi:flagellar biosynthesis protein FliR
MAKGKDIIKTIQEFLKTAAELGFSLILVLVVIDILFPGVTGIAQNLSTIVGGFASEGAVGLVALLIFLIIYKR